MQSKDKRQFKNKAMKFNIQDYAMLRATEPVCVKCDIIILFAMTSDFISLYVGELTPPLYYKHLLLPV